MRNSSNARRPLRAIGVAALVAAGTVVAPSAVPVPSAGAVSCTSYCGGGEFHPVPLAHLVDTAAKLNDVAPLGPKPIGPTAPSFDVTVLGKGNLPPQGPAPLAEVLTVIIGNPSVTGSLALWGVGDTPAPATINFVAHVSVATTVIVHAGTAGKVRMVMRGATNGTARIIVDQVGWFSTTGYDGSYTGGDPRGWRTIPVLNPARLLDTRNGAAADTPMGPATDRAVAIRGAKPIGGTTAVVPNDATVVGALVSVTAWSSTALTHLTVTPGALTRVPSVAQVYAAPGQVRSNMAFVPVGADGKIHVFNSSGSTNVTVDLLAYLRVPGTETTRVGRIVPLAAPFRAFDTRQAAFGQVPLGPGQAEDWSFAAFASSVKIGGTWVGKQVAFIGTLTNTSLARQYTTVPVGNGSLTMYPASQGRPAATTLPTREGVRTSGPALVRYGTNQVVRVYNQTGYAHYVLDVGAVVLAD